MARKFSFWHQRKQQTGKLQRNVLARRRRSFVSRGTMLSLESLEDRRLLAAGSLDTTFNPSGAIPGMVFSSTATFAPFGVNSDGDEAAATAIQADGKILVASEVLPSSGSSNYDVMISRYNADGTVDTTFGTSGATSFDFTSGQSLVREMLLDSSGRIIVVGQAVISGQGVFAVARLTSGGALDTTFNTTGKLTTAFGATQADALAVAIQSDGKIVVGGVSGATTSGNFALRAVQRERQPG